MLSLQSFLREVRVVGLCWANFNLKDLKDLRVEEVGELGLPVARAALAWPPKDDPTQTVTSSLSTGASKKLYQHVRQPVFFFKKRQALAWRGT